MSKRPILSVRNLHRSYQSGPKILNVLTGADIDIYPGEMVGLIGPSGSGKSTLLHAAGLLEKPNAGEVYINGRECLKLPDDERTAIRRETIGVVYQFHHLQKEFSAIDNVAIPQMIAGKSHKDAQAEANRLIGIMPSHEPLPINRKSYWLMNLRETLTLPLREMCFKVYLISRGLKACQHL